LKWKWQERRLSSGYQGINNPNFDRSMIEESSSLSFVHKYLHGLHLESFYLPLCDTNCPLWSTIYEVQRTIKRLLVLRDHIEDPNSIRGSIEDLCYRMNVYYRIWRSCSTHSFYNTNLQYDFVYCWILQSVATVLALSLQYNLQYFYWAPTSVALFWPFDHTFGILLGLLAVGRCFT
jgi:hypothetical protein